MAKLTLWPPPLHDEPGSDTWLAWFSTVNQLLDGLSKEDGVITLPSVGDLTITGNIIADVGIFGAGADPTTVDSGSKMHIVCDGADPTGWPISVVYDDKVTLFDDTYQESYLAKSSSTTASMNRAYGLCSTSPSYNPYRWLETIGWGSQTSAPNTWQWLVYDNQGDANYPFAMFAEGKCGIGQGVAATSSYATDWELLIHPGSVGGTSRRGRLGIFSSKTPSVGHTASSGIDLMTYTGGSGGVDGIEIADIAWNGPITPTMDRTSTARTSLARIWVETIDSSAHTMAMHFSVDGPSATGGEKERFIIDKDKFHFNVMTNSDFSIDDAEHEHTSPLTTTDGYLTLTVGGETKYIQLYNATS